MKKLLIMCFLFSLSFAESQWDRANILKKEPQTQETAAELFLEMSLTGNPSAMIELGKLFIYGKGMQQDCKKGIIYFFNAVSGEEKDYNAFNELSLLFKRGICVEKNEEKSKKYEKIYYEKTKKL